MGNDKLLRVPPKKWLPLCMRRVAQEAGLWGPALLVARSLGEAAFQACAAAMAAATLAPGQPLHTLCLLLAGQLPASILPPAAQPGMASALVIDTSWQAIMQSSGR